MSSVSSTNPGLSDLLQTLTNSGSSVLSTVLSAPGVESALEQAPPADLVALSDQALQLQVVGALFGSPSTDPGTDSMFALLGADSGAGDLNNTATLSSLFDLQA